MTTSAPTDAALYARFAEIFEHIGKGAIAREQRRELARDAVQQLKDSGFTALRVPREYGGSGISLPQYFRLLTRLGEADSNLPQIIRAHSGFIEQRLESEDEAARQRWLVLIPPTHPIGASTSEPTGPTHTLFT